MPRDRLFVMALPVSNSKDSSNSAVHVLREVVLRTKLRTKHTPVIPAAVPIWL